MPIPFCCYKLRSNLIVLAAALMLAPPAFAQTIGSGSGGGGTGSCATMTSTTPGCATPDNTSIIVTGGVISAVAGSPPVGTNTTQGILSGDNSTLTVTAGSIACTTMTSSQIGCAKPDNSTMAVAAGVLTATTVTSIATGCGGYSAGGAITSTGEIDANQASIAHVSTDTIANSECGRLGTFNSGSAVAITLPQANAAGAFPPGWFEDFTNYGAGLVTFTTTTSTFLNNGTSSITLSQGQSFRLISSTASSGNWDVSGNLLAAGVSTVSNSDGTLTISPTSGAVVASIALGHANTWAAVQTFTNSDIKLLGSSTGATTFTSANAGASNFTLTFPAATDTLAAIGTAQTWTAAQTFTNSDIKLLGSSSGATTFTSANAGASNFTITVPAVTDTLAVLGTAQTFTATQTFGAVIGTVTPDSTTSRTLAATDCGTTIRFTSNSAITVTIPATMPVGCNIAIDQAGTGKVSVNGTAVTAATLNTHVASSAATGTAGQYAVIGIIIVANAGGSAAVAVLTGDGS